MVSRRLGGLALSTENDSIQRLDLNNLVKQLRHKKFCKAGLG